MKWTVDRIENDIAVCEDENLAFVNVKLSSLPQGTKEGSVLQITLDNSEENNRKERIDNLMNSLFKD
jgi:hypothetical protein